MSQTPEQLKEDYLKQRQQTEDKIDDLYSAKRKGIQILEEIGNASRYYTKAISDDPIALNDGLRALNNLGDEFQDTCQKEVRKLNNELEDMESDYRRAYHELSE